MKRVIVALAMLAACSPAPESPQEAAAPTEAPAPAVPAAPAPEVVSLRILKNQNGQTIEVPLNRPFSVELRGEQAQGFSWAPVQTPSFIAAAPDGTAALPAPEAAPDRPPVVGLGGMQTFFFVASAPGSGDLVLEHRRFGGAPHALDTFRVTIVAR